MDDRCFRTACRTGLFTAVLALGAVPAAAESTPMALRPDIEVSRVVTTASAAKSIRLAKNPVNTLFYMQRDGSIWRVDPAAQSRMKVITAAAHGVSNPQGFAIGPDNTFYISGNEDVDNAKTRAILAKGIWDAANGVRVWSVLARTVAYEKSNTSDHLFNGIIVNPNGAHIYVNSGSRTDHGEVQSAGGLHPDTREVGLTACILKLPRSGSDIVLQNDRAWLRANGFLFAEGTRNTFDMAFAPSGDLIGADNGPDRDMADELNWLRAGRHYGFPWRMGAADNPQQFAGYDPALDLLLDGRFGAVARGDYHNDPTFPTRPAGVAFTDPIPSSGPDADSFRDPVDGVVRDASALGLSISTFTPHRSPLGLVFDRAQVLAPEFRGDGFVLSWTWGDATGNSFAGPFHDASQDLLHLDLSKNAGVYSVRTTRIVTGFNNPIDAELIGRSLYVLDYSGTQSIWKVRLP